MVEYRGEIASRPQNRPTGSPINVADQPLATKSPVRPAGRVSAACRVPKRVNRGLTGGRDGRRYFRPRPWVGSRSSPLEAVVERLLEHPRGEHAILQRHGGERCQRGQGSGVIRQVLLEAARPVGAFFTR